jgi:glycosyltransferase involved in cell wall biosynthesis
MSGLAALEAVRGIDAPRPAVVQTFHALGVVKRRHHGPSDPSPPERAATEEWIAREVDRIVATCSDEVFELIRLGADRRRVSVTPCGVDLDAFTPGGPAEQRPAGRSRILALARLVERKGVGDVVTALARLPDAELIVAGGPEAAGLARDAEACRLMSLARELGVADRVQMRGRVEREQVPALLRSADVVACVPWYEPFGIVPLEAMACGIPVVASAVGGQIDTVVDGVTGIHVSPRRPTELARALGALLGDPARRQRLGAAGAARARARYGWDEIAASTLEAYAAAGPAESTPVSRSVTA